MEHVSRDDVHMSGRSNTANCNVIDYILNQNLLQNTQTAQTAHPDAQRYRPNGTRSSDSDDPSNAYTRYKAKAAYLPSITAYIT